MTICTRRHQEAHNIANRRSTLNKGEIVSKVGKPCTLIRVNRVGKVMCPMQRMRKTWNVKLTSWRKSYAAHGGGASFEFESSSGDTEDDTYRQRSRTPPSETFSGGEEYSSYRRKSKSTLHKGLGNKDMNEALNQVAKSPFMRRIEGASLPRRFNQPTFSLYNGRTYPVEHVSHFNQKWPSIQRMRP